MPTKGNGSFSSQLTANSLKGIPMPCCNFCVHQRHLVLWRQHKFHFWLSSSHSFYFYWFNLAVCLSLDGNLYSQNNLSINAMHKLFVLLLFETGRWANHSSKKMQVSKLTLFFQCTILLVASVVGSVVSSELSVKNGIARLVARVK